MQSGTHLRWLPILGVGFVARSRPTLEIFAPVCEPGMFRAGLSSSPTESRLAGNEAALEVLASCAHVPRLPATVLAAAKNLSNVRRL